MALHWWWMVVLYAIKPFNSFAKRIPLCEIMRHYNQEVVCFISAKTSVVLSCFLQPFQANSDLIPPLGFKPLSESVLR